MRTDGVRAPRYRKEVLNELVLTLVQVLRRFQRPGFLLPGLVGVRLLLPTDDSFGGGVLSRLYESHSPYNYDLTSSHQQSVFDRQQPSTIFM